MYIESNIFNWLMKNMPDRPPEIGGIIGGNNDVIKYIQLDIGMKQKCGCSYQPNTIMLNKKIREWSNISIDFYGIFHTHFYNVYTLSEGDKRYIEKILLSMPNEVNKLYFPIVVIPRYELVPYCATKINGIVKIKRDKLIIKEEI